MMSVGDLSRGVEAGEGKPLVSDDEQEQSEDLMAAAGDLSDGDFIQVCAPPLYTRLALPAALARRAGPVRSLLPGLEQLPVKWS